MRVVQPSVSETAFSCPHCGVLAVQRWHSLLAVTLPDGDPVPKECVSRLRESKAIAERCCSRCPRWNPRFGDRRTESSLRKSLPFDLIVSSAIIAKCLDR